MSWNFYKSMTGLKNWYFRSYLMWKWFFDIFWPCGKKKGAYTWNFRKLIRKNFFWSQGRILKRIGGSFWKLSKKLLYCLPLLWGFYSYLVANVRSATERISHIMSNDCANYVPNVLFRAKFKSFPAKSNFLLRHFWGLRRKNKYRVNCNK